ncbi:Na(+)/H(+) antiporter subunit [Lentibacillus sp. JNUCC-1]|uniref:monovalent cation/H(+) antiporter subunit G n=1 Tax=Lentibacillus sp. JNUCC-1 TaxID=2654513 RepID=UPI0012E86B50|nr:monovalent cation/H(+) antiporter subunit G [Lentibacillus sp. JNUCC-1]MUV39555.1 Na(+)/H(+) antiporter subunit [Lentibacillus sp. JNUCC-1]
MIETGTEILLNVSVALFLLIGTFFVLSSSLGIVRFPDLYTRLHAATKASTLGISAMLIGTFIFLYAEHDIVSGKLLLAIIFILLTAPVSGHMISRAAHRSGVKPIAPNRSDAYEDDMQKQENY